MAWDSPGGGGGYSDVLYTRRLESLFGGSKFRMSIFLGVFRKINIFWGMKILWMHKIGLYLGVISMHFRVFS